MLHQQWHHHHQYQLGLLHDRGPEAGNFTLPDLAALIPRSLPVFDDDGASTYAAAGSSSNYAMNTALALIGSSLTYLFV
jgi:hypothetical protein